MATVFSGVIPTVTVFKNSQANSLVGGLLNNAVTSGVSVALNGKIGSNLYNALGLDSNITKSNFIGSVVTPGLISTGADVLGQTVATSLSNSKALGPFGPLAGNLAQAGINILRDQLTNSLFGQPAADKSSQFFPGAGGEGEGEPYYGGGKAYALAGPGGPDVVFTISPAITPAAAEATKSTQAPPSGAPGAVPAAGAPASAAPATPAGSPASAPGSPSATDTTPPPPPAPTAPPTAPPPPPSGASPAAATAPTAPAGAPVPGATQPPAPKVKPNKINPKPKPLPAGWSFICPPEEISWETTAQADRVPIFGANQAPVTAGVRGMRDLNLSGAIVEGFNRRKTIEGKVIALEELLAMSMSADSRYVKIPVYKVTANTKIYGFGKKDAGCFIIKSIKVQEKLRDMNGNATRAIVDISLTQVPYYQVEDGRDIAYKSIAGTKGPFVPISEAVTATGNAALKQQGVAGQAAQNVTPPKP